MLGGGAGQTASVQPKIFGPKEHGIQLDDVSTNAIRVTQTLQKAGFKAFVVGGAVRDLVLGLKPKDFDVATDATPEEIRRLFRRAFIIGRRFQIVHVMFGQDLIEVTTFRGNSADEAQKAECCAITPLASNTKTLLDATSPSTPCITTPPSSWYSIITAA